MCKSVGVLFWSDFSIVNIVKLYKREYRFKFSHKGNTQSTKKIGYTFA